LDPVDGVLDVLEAAAEQLGCSQRELLKRGTLFVHGTTVATNAIVTGRCARTAFLSTAGHPDILLLREGGRIGLPLFDFSIEYPKPFIPRSLSFEVPERIGPAGEIVEPLDETRVHAIIDELVAAKVEAAAICLLWSIANPVHELRVGELIGTRIPNMAVSLSHRVNPSLREYRRASSTAIDVALKPLMSRYLHALEERLRDAGYPGRLLVVTSQGMTKDAEEVAATPIHALKSGPAMAPIAGQYLVRRAGLGDSAIIADTGGTTYDVALVRHGEIPETRETWIGRPHMGHMTGFPSVDIRSVGAGGGSIARVDAGGLLRVGPESTGAVPGPACYGHGGTHATVTDAAVLLGYIDPSYFLGGRKQLDSTRSRDAIACNVGGPLGLDVEDAAAAIIALATETMAGAIEDITVSQGIDPRSAVLIGGGGAAGLNSVAIARRIGCRDVLFPDAGAAISAIGGLLCPLSDEHAEFHLERAGKFDIAAVNRILATLQLRCEAFLRRVTSGPRGRITFSVEARYVAQIWEIKVPLQASRFNSADDLTALIDRFHLLHRDVFAFLDRYADIEFVCWRARASVDLRDQPLGTIARESPDRSTANRRRAWFDGAFHDVPVLGLPDMPDDQPLEGPAIIETALTSIVIPPEASFRHQSDVGVIVETHRTARV
jgi:N-methylhydantoinase A